MQTARLQPDSASNLQMIDVKERAYYKLLKEKKGFLLPGSNRRTFAIDPVISWSVGEYQINFAQENIYCNSEDASYMVLSSNFPSMVETVFPAGYGYCLIDAQGNVLKNGKEQVVTYLDKARYDRVRSCNKYRITVRLRTSENNGNLPFVTFYDFQKVRAKIGVKANAKVTF